MQPQKDTILRKKLLQNGGKYVILTIISTIEAFYIGAVVCILSLIGGFYRMIKIAVIGFGNIGSGLVELVDKNKDIIAKDCGTEVEIKYIVDIRDFSGHPLENKIIADFNTVVNDPEISVVAEMIGGSHPAFEFTLAALKSGKHVVSSNKEVVANYGDVLLKAAEENNVAYLFEAAVGGAIPIIRPMRTSLSSDSILAVDGILNGTTNFILTSMFSAGSSFEAALSKARELGYAEADPSADVDGIDACRKICILSALAYGKIFDCSAVYTEGIRSVSSRDVSDASAIGAAIKLIGHTSLSGDGRVEMMVSPRMIPLSHPLSHISDVFNGIMVSAQADGDLMFYGRGAGRIPTAGAVLADIVEIVKHLDRGQVATLKWERAETDQLMPVKEMEFSYYVRVNGDSVPECAKIVSSADGETAFLLPKVKEAECDEMLGKLEVVSKIRFLD